jgi:hypothetical protein
LGTSKNKINIWQEFAKETSGTFKEGYSWRSDSNEIEYKNWKLVFLIVEYSPKKCLFL